MFCNNCGKEIADAALSCPACGQPTGNKEKSPKKKITTALLCLFLGIISAHRFYVGKPGTAILQIITFGGCGIWLIIDFIVILCGGFKDGEGRKLS